MQSARAIRRSSFAPTHGGLLPVLATVFLIVVLAGCQSQRMARTLDLELTSGPGGKGYVASEIAGVPSGGAFDYRIEEFSSPRVKAGTVVGTEWATITVADRSDLWHYAGASNVVGGLEGPASGRMIGDGGYLLLSGGARVALDGAATVMGMHVSLTGLGARAHQGLPAYSALEVLFTGHSPEGGWTSTVSVTPAYARGGGADVESNWIWADLTELGVVDQLLIQVRTPLRDSVEMVRRGLFRRRQVPAGSVLEYGILADNLTVSRDFRKSDDYFTVALLPETEWYVSDNPDILLSQIRYLSDAREKEDIVFVSLLGGLVSDPDDQEQWERLSRAMLVLDESVPYGVALGDGDFVDDWDDMEESSPGFSEYFTEDRFQDQPWWGGFSESGMSSYQVVSTPVGRLLYLHLMPSSPEEELEWAQDVLDRHRQIPTAVTINRYLDHNSRVDDVIPPAGAGVEWTGISPESLFREFIRPNGQIFLVTCSYYPDEYLQLSRNPAGEYVIEMLQGFHDRPDGGAGYLRLLRFYPGRNELRLLTYSPWLDRFEQDADSTAVIPIDFGRLGR